MTPTYATRVFSPLKRDGLTPACAGAVEPREASLEARLVFVFLHEANARSRRDRPRKGGRHRAPRVFSRKAQKGFLFRVAAFSRGFRRARRRTPKTVFVFFFGLRETSSPARAARRRKRHAVDRWVPFAVGSSPRARSSPTPRVSRGTRPRASQPRPERPPRRKPSNATKFRVRFVSPPPPPRVCAPPPRSRAPAQASPRAWRRAPQRPPRARARRPA